MNAFLTRSFQELPVNCWYNTRNPTISTIDFVAIYLYYLRRSLTSTVNINLLKYVICTYIRCVYASINSKYRCEKYALMKYVPNGHIQIKIKSYFYADSYRLHLIDYIQTGMTPLIFCRIAIYGSQCYSHTHNRLSTAFYDGIGVL